MYCKNCGKEIEEVKFCPYCGAEQTSTQTTQTENVDQGQSYANDDESHIGFAVLSFFIPIVGLVLYLVWNKEYPKKAKSCLNGFIAGVVLYVVFICCMIRAGIGFASAVEEQYYDWDFNAIVETVPYE